MICPIILCGNLLPHGKGDKSPYYEPGFPIISMWGNLLRHGKGDKSPYYEPGLSIISMWGNLLRDRKGDESPYYEPGLSIISMLTDLGKAIMHVAFGRVRRRIALLRTWFTSHIDVDRLLSKVVIYRGVI